jgi:hypothetical protein
VDDYFEDLSFEVICTYDIINKDSYEFYGGLGGRFVDFGGVVIPWGSQFIHLRRKVLAFIWKLLRLWL